MTRDGRTSYLSRCEGVQAVPVAETPPNQPSNGLWTFGGHQGVYERSTSDANGNSITFTCDDIGQNGGLFIELAGQPIVGGGVNIDIDGRDFSFPVWADGGKINTECSACQSNYTELWSATAAGNIMTINADDGLFAVFNLRGSRAALGDTACVPDDGL